MNRFENAEISPFQIPDVPTSGIVRITVIARRKAEFVYKDYYSTASDVIGWMRPTLRATKYSGHIPPDLLRAQIFHKKSHPQSTLLKVGRKPLMESLIK